MLTSSVGVSVAIVQLWIKIRQYHRVLFKYPNFSVIIKLYRNHKTVTNEDTWVQTNDYNMLSLKSLFEEIDTITSSILDKYCPLCTRTTLAWIMDTSPTGQFAYCLVVLPTGHFDYGHIAYKTFRQLDSSPTRHFAYYLDNSPTDCPFCLQNCGNEIRCVDLTRLLIRTTVLA